MTDLTQRAEAMRSRLRLRAWEHRQRHGSKGTWKRLRRLLAGSASAYVIDDVEGNTLAAEGFIPAPVGSELEPTRRFFVVPQERASRLASGRATDVRLSAELLVARCVVLVPFVDP